MAGFFSPDSKLYRFMCRLTDIVKLNLLWLLFSLPAVTAGISTIAAYTVTLHMAEDTEGRVAHEFIKAFKSNWKQGLPMTFISIICLWAVYLDFELFRVAEKNAMLFLVIGIIAAYVFVFSLLYVYPLLARYENTVLNCLKNSFRISMKYFMRSLLLVVIIALEIAVIMWNYTTIFVGLLMGPVCIMLTVSGFAMKIFRELDGIEEP
ncbi:MAG: DUF624 domain-containing protein [Ruminococcus sp.]|nr:DUF624 domain-containing protein [Ruminococcus sp.]